MQEDVDVAQAAVAAAQEKLKLLPAERDEFAARAATWADFIESHAPAFRFEGSERRQFSLFIEVRLPLPSLIDAFLVCCCLPTSAARSRCSSRCACHCPL